MRLKRLLFLLSLSIICATLLTLALSIPNVALGYGETASAGTGAEVVLFAIAGTGMLVAGILLARRSRN